MSIDRMYDDYILSCDICGAEYIFPDFAAAVEYKRDNGWKSRRGNGEWADICPDCQRLDGGTP